MTNPTAATILIVRDHSVLSVSRRGSATEWGLPGGKIDQGEDPKDAALRELREETGVILDPDDVVEIYQGTDPASGAMVVTYCFSPRPGGGRESNVDDATSQESEIGVLWLGWRSLIDGPFGKYNAEVRKAYVDRDPLAWTLENGSGTLRRAIEQRMDWCDLYLEERVAFEFGYGFQPCLVDRIQRDEKAIAHGDHKLTTETCWWARVMASRGHSVEIRDIVIPENRGIALIVSPYPRPHWLPEGCVLLAFTEDGNPC